MSKFFFKGRVDARQDYRSYGNKTKPEANPGSEHNPIELWVANAAREQEIKALLIGQRKQKLLSDLENNMYERAVKAKEITRFD